MPMRKSDAYRRLQARNKARKDAFAIHTEPEESKVSLLSTLVAYVLEAIDEWAKGGLHFQYSRRKEVITKNRPARKQYEIRNRGRRYMVTIEDLGPVTGVSPEDYLEYGGPDPGTDEEEYVGGEGSGS